MKQALEILFLVAVAACCSRYVIGWWLMRHYDKPKALPKFHYEMTAADVAHTLLGTCDDLSSRVEEYLFYSEDDLLAALQDEGIERCEICGWWCEDHELNEDLTCEECQRDYQRHV